jgi:hypothetical protein
MANTGAPTPIYFSGKIKHPNPMPPEESIRTEGGFIHWLMTVWVNEHTPPTEPSALKRFDVRSARAEHRAYVDAGGTGMQRGLSLEEQWLGSQLLFRSPVTCLLNESQPTQELTRITRLRRLSAAEIWAELEHAFANPKLNKVQPEMAASVDPFVMAVYDGDEIAHYVTAWTIHEGELHYHDPWPGRSLLCAEHNSAGVAARESNLVPHWWRISRAEFERVVFAVFLHTLADAPPPAIELTPTERESANLRELAIGLCRALNGPHAKPIKIGETISRLECAALLNCVWEVKVAINEADDVNQRGRGGATALHVAAEKGHLLSFALVVGQGGCRA